MGEYSRVKKYEELRNSLQQEQSDNTSIQQVLEGFDKTQNNVKEVKQYQPTHRKQAGSEHLVEKTGEFKNEYLDTFIQEVRDYNIKKGVRENDDTRLDILQQLSSKQRKKRASYIEQVDEEKEVVHTNPVQIELEQPTIENNEEAVANTQSIAKQVQELLANEDVKSVQVSTREDSPLDNSIQSLKKAEINPVYEDEEDKNSFTISFEEQELLNQQLLDETLKLRTQLDEYEEELTTLNDDVDKNNRLLNIIITVLILMLFAVIIIVGYWLVSGGIL